jgi:acetyltransferase-like isoleucine patch superfamily enzyme
VDSPGSTSAPTTTAARAGGGDAGSKGVVAALTAYAYLWRCRRVGARARTLGRPLLANPGNLELGADVLIDSRDGQVVLACLGRGRLVVGDGARIGPSTRIETVRYVEIGDRTRIGAGCVICDAGAAGEPDAEIWIGDDVTIGDGVRVLPGTVIGAGAVVAAGSVVRGRIPPGAAVAGDPRPSGEAGGAQTC